MDRPPGHRPSVRPLVTTLGHGRHIVETDGLRREAFALRLGGVAWVFVDGETWTFGADMRHGTQSALESDDALAAPMPARVLTVSVQPGQKVSSGEVLVTLEAMKMELPVRAPRDGTVKAVSCQTGRMVAAGERLVELE